MLLMKQWEEDHLLLPGGAWIMVPVGMMAPPEDSWKARGLDEEHVKSLANNSNSRVLTTRIYRVVLFKVPGTPGGALAEALQREVKDAKTDQAKSVAIVKNLESLILTFKEQVVRGGSGCFKTYSGNHGYHAVDVLGNRYPKNTSYHRLRCYILVAEYTQLSVENLFFVGTWENTSQDLAKRTGFAESVLRMRQMFMNVSKLSTSFSQNGTLGKVESGDVLKRAKAAFGWSQAEAGLAWTMAQMERGIWVLLEAILLGRTSHEHPKTLIPKSSHHLNSMAKIPPALLISWLQDVIAAGSTLKNFKDKCLCFKVARKIYQSLPTYALEFTVPPLVCPDVGQWREGLEDTDIIENIKTNYPGVTQIVTDAAWEGKGRALKNIPSSGTTAQIRQYLLRQQQMMEEKKADEQKVIIFELTFSFQIILFVILISGSGIWKTTVPEDRPLRF